MTYLSCAETAKLVRNALKPAFPGVKFSVRSSTYAGGASIHIGWTDGPQEAEVDKVVQPYAGSSFDGMIDLKTSNTDWLYPDGRVEAFQYQVGHSYGSTTYDGSGDAVDPEEARNYIAGTMLAAGEDTGYKYDPGSPACKRGRADATRRRLDGARLVHFGADYIFTSRAFSDSYRQYLEQAVLTLSGQPGPFASNTRYDFGIEIPGRAYEDYGSTLVWHLSRHDPAALQAALARETERAAARS
jgi:hypothetical protein